MYSSEWKGGVPTITYSQEKDHLTDKITKIRFNIELAGVNPADVSRLQIMSTFKYRLRDILNLDMVGMMQAVVETPVGAGKVLLKGQLKFE